MTTIAELVLSRAEEHSTRTALLFEDRAWTWAEYAQACVDRASVLVDMQRPGPFHVGVLLDNVPEFPMWLGAGALVGAGSVVVKDVPENKVVVGNPARVIADTTDYEAYRVT